MNLTPFPLRATDLCAGWRRWRGPMMRGRRGLRLRADDNQGNAMKRYREVRAWAVMAAAVLCVLSGCASVGKGDVAGLPMEQRVGPGLLGAGLVGAPAGWPEAVPLPEGAPIDGYRCVGRHCTLWFGLMNLDEVMALKRNYIKLLRDSGQWELLGADDQYEPQAFRYTGKTESACGYTLEIKQGLIPNDYYHRWRVSTSLTW